MRTGLAASTVTPGSTAPEVSFTTPVIDACANTVAGSNTAATTTAKSLPILRIDCPPMILQLPGLLREPRLPTEGGPRQAGPPPLLLLRPPARRCGRVDHGSVPMLDELAIANAECVERERFEPGSRRRGGGLAEVL